MGIQLPRTLILSPNSPEKWCCIQTHLPLLTSKWTTLPRIPPAGKIYNLDQGQEKWWLQSRCCQIPLSPSAGQLQRHWNDRSPPRFCPSGNTWQCLEIIIVMTCGSATDVWWAEIRDLAKHVTVLGRIPPQSIIYPMPLVMSPRISARVFQSL